MGPLIRKAVEVAGRYGVEVRLRIPSDPILGTTFYPGPGACGVYWPLGPIVISDPWDDAGVAVNIMHELTHLVVGGASPELQNEVTGPGAAMDHAHFRAVDPGLQDSNGPEWNPGSQAAAVAAGLLDANGELTYRRPGS